MITQEKSLKELMLQLCSTDELRENLTKPIVCENFLYATDGHIMTRIPLEDVDFEFEESNVWDRPKEQFEKFPRNICITYDYNAIKDKLQEIELVLDTKIIECEDCEGFGSVEDTCPCCGNEETKPCSKCNGDGDIEIKGTQMVPNYDDYLIEINGSRFWPKYIAQLLEVCQYQTTPTIELIHSAERQPSIFRVGELEVLLMPNMADDVKILKIAPYDSPR